MANNNIVVKVNGRNKATVQTYNASKQEAGKAVMSTKDNWQAEVVSIIQGM
jgi:hypothetical protein